LVPPTPTISAEDSAARELQTPAEKQGVTNEADVQPQPQAQNLLPTVPRVADRAGGDCRWAVGMLLMRQSAASRWQRK
jgi:hypothetical protein